ncbi:MAG: DUF1385 domain-containing protein [Lachnospiraceae bacterium]
MKNSGIGGQAVLEGIMMRSRSAQAVAVRKSDGTIQVKKEELNTPRWMKKVRKIPIVRGCCSFFISMIDGVKAINDSADMIDDDDEDSGKSRDKDTPGEAGRKKSGKDSDIGAGMIFTVLISLAIAILLFTVLPFRLSRLFSGVISSVSALNIIEGVIRLLIFVGYLWGISLARDIRRTYMYHGAEHKCINCLETGHELTVENVMASSRFHRRCSTSFLFVVVFISVILFIFIRSGSPGVQLLFRILLIPVISGISYEMLMYAGSHDNRLARVMSSPGLLMQRLTTKEPDSGMVEVAIQAVEAVFDWRAYLENESADDKCENSRETGSREA